MDWIGFAANLIDRMGVVGLLILVVGALVWWLLRRTIPRESYELLQHQIDEQRAELQELRYECKETIIPTIGRIADIQEKQYEVMRETLHHVNQLENRFEEVYRLDAPVSGRRSRKDD
jgi:hypothetical protein